jgi:hypothetical protein
MPHFMYLFKFLISSLTAIGISWFPQFMYLFNFLISSLTARGISWFPLPTFFVLTTPFQHWELYKRLNTRIAHTIYIFFYFIFLISSLAAIGISWFGFPFQLCALWTAEQTTYKNFFCSLLLYMKPDQPSSMNGWTNNLKTYSALYYINMNVRPASTTNHPYFSKN